MTGHSGIVVGFQHPEDRQNAKARFRVAGLRQFKIVPQCCNLIGECGRRLTLRGTLAYARIKRLAGVVLFEESKFGLSVARFGCDPAIEPREIVGSLQQRLWRVRSAQEDLIPDNAQQGSQEQPGSDAKAWVKCNSHGGPFTL